MEWTGEHREKVKALTARQIQCLQLVPRGSSKQIAQELSRQGESITHHTVEKHIKSAMKTLGVSDRKLAAALVERYLKRVPPAPRLSTSPESSKTEIDDDRQRPAQELREERADYTPTASIPLELVLVPPGRGARNKLTPLGRLLVTLGILILVLLALGFVVNAMEGLERVFLSTPL